MFRHQEDLIGLVGSAGPGGIGTLFVLDLQLALIFVFLLGETERSDVIWRQQLTVFMFLNPNLRHVSGSGSGAGPTVLCQNRFWLDWSWWKTLIPAASGFCGPDWFLPLVSFNPPSCRGARVWTQNQTQNPCGSRLLSGGPGAAALSNLLNKGSSVFSLSCR